ncbi:MAG TPA: MlaD family protein [Acidimicrobiales bacterium]|jgi:phospholipid/cholesterol/gamma-HCH transport system substrate-binding protein|nr:MlaD family protein [Acidimicrobiales bacterium]
MSRFQVSLRLIGLVLVAVIGAWFITVNVLGDGVGTAPYSVTVNLAQGGGLFPESYVTYRGVDVGRVASLKATPSRVVATLEINAGVHIPADLSAQVHDLSVAGEQYLDLVPRASSGPDLHAGSVIDQSRTRVPVAISDLLSDAARLIASVHAKDIHTISTALGSGFADTGPDLRRITEAANKLVHALQASRSATSTIITAGGPVLEEAQASAENLAQISQSLAGITAQLSASNTDVNALLTEGVPFTTALNQLLAQDGTTIAALVQHLATVSDVAGLRQPAVQSLLSELPAFTHKIASVVAGGSVQVHITYDNANTVCPYVLGAQVAEPTAKTGSPALNNTCTLTAPDLLQRGSADAPRPAGDS